MSNQRNQTLRDSLIFLLIALSVMTGCTKQPEIAISAESTDCHADKSADGNVPSPTPIEQLYPVVEVAEAITLRLKQEAYPVGVQQMTLVLENRSDSVLLYGQGWSFARWENDAWQPLDNREDAAFTSEGHILYDHSRALFPISTFALATPLTEGLYRVTGCALRTAQNDENLGADGSYTDHPAYELVFRVATDAQAESPSQDNKIGANGLPNKEDWEWYAPGSCIAFYETRGYRVWQLVQDDWDGSFVAVLYRENSPENEVLGENALLSLDLFDRTTGDTFSVFGKPMVRQDQVYASETGGFWMETTEGQYFAGKKNGEWVVSPF